MFTYINTFVYILTFYKTIKNRMCTKQRNFVLKLQGTVKKKSAIIFLNIYHFYLTNCKLNSLYLKMTAPNFNLLYLEIDFQYILPHFIFKGSFQKFSFVFKKWIYLKNNICIYVLRKKFSYCE